MRKKQWVVLLFCIAYIFIQLLLSVFIMNEANHDCNEEECHICYEIEMCVSLLNNEYIVPMIVAIIVWIVKFYNSGYSPLLINKTSDSLVSLKVKLTI